MALLVPGVRPSVALPPCLWPCSKCSGLFPSQQHCQQHERRCRREHQPDPDNDDADLLDAYLDDVAMETGGGERPLGPEATWFAVEAQVCRQVREIMRQVCPHVTLPVAVDVTGTEGNADDVTEQADDLIELPLVTEPGRLVIQPKDEGSDEGSPQHCPAMPEESDNDEGWREPAETDDVEHECEESKLKNEDVTDDLEFDLHDYPSLTPEDSFTDEKPPQLDSADAEKPASDVITRRQQHDAEVRRKEFLKTVSRKFVSTAKVRVICKLCHATCHGLQALLAAHAYCDVTARQRGVAYSYGCVDCCDCHIADMPALRAHVAHYHVKGGLRFPCSYCDERFSEEAELRAHERGHRTCPDCGKVFLSVQRYKRHQREVHGAAADVSCPDCGKTFRRSRHLAIHRHSCKNRRRKQPTDLEAIANNIDNDLHATARGETAKVKTKVIKTKKKSAGQCVAVIIEDETEIKKEETLKVKKKIKKRPAENKGVTDKAVKAKAVKDKVVKDMDVQDKAVMDKDVKDKDVKVSQQQKKKQKRAVSESNTKSEEKQADVPKRKRTKGEKKKVKQKTGPLRTCVRCGVCYKLFPNALEYRQHIKEAHGGVNVCKCGKKFKALQHLAIHKFACSFLQAEKEKAKNREDKSSVCDSDSKKMDSENLNGLEHLPSDSVSYPCGVCGKKFDVRSKMKVHRHFCEKKLRQQLTEQKLMEEVGKAENGGECKGTTVEGNIKEVSNGEMETGENETESRESENESRENESRGNETDRMENETERMENETECVENETERMENENERIENETERMENEINAQSGEYGNQTHENEHFDESRREYNEEHRVDDDEGKVGAGSSMETELDHGVEEREIESDCPQPEQEDIPITDHCEGKCESDCKEELSLPGVEEMYPKRRTSRAVVERSDVTEHNDDVSDAESDSPSEDDVSDDEDPDWQPAAAKPAGKRKRGEPVSDVSTDDDDEDDDDMMDDDVIQEVRPRPPPLKKTVTSQKTCKVEDLNIRAAPQTSTEAGDNKDESQQKAGDVIQTDDIIDEVVQRAKRPLLLTCRVCHGSGDDVTAFVTSHRDCANDSRAEGLKYLYVCTSCGNIALNNVKIVRSHVQRMHSGNFACSRCKTLNFDSAEEYVEHMMRHRTCAHCFLDCGSPLGVLRHTEEEHPDKLVICEHCKRRFNSAQALQQHAHSKPNGTCVARPKHACPECGKQHRSRQGLLKHMLSHRVYPCWQCDVVLARHNLFVDHMTSVHQEIAVERCEFCHTQFSHRNQLFMHQAESHSDQLDITHCRSCQQFVPAKNLYEHRHTCVGKMTSAGYGKPSQKPGMCDACGSYYKNIRQHMNNVHGERKFVCYVCDKGFKAKAHLKAHEQIHNDKVTYVCSFCGKSFRAENSLTVHLWRSHNVGGKKHKIKKVAGTDDKDKAAGDGGDLCDSAMPKLERQVNVVNT